MSAISVCGGVFASNPFADVPSDHWAYSCLSDLSQAGVVYGYEDGLFKGDRLMTRYEMAQIVAYAMSKGASGTKFEKLKAEFAEELNQIGIKVEALEKKQDNVKITGEVRAHFGTFSKDVKNVYNTNRTEQLRTRLIFTGKVNDNWDYEARLENIQDLEEYHPVGEEQVAFQHAYLNGRLGGTKMKAGRFTLTRDGDGNIYDDRFNGVEVSYGNKYKIGGYFGKPATYDTLKQKGDYARGEGWERAYGVNFTARPGKLFTLDVGYDKFSRNAHQFDDNGIIDAGLKYSVGKFGAGMTWFKSDSDTAKNTNGFVGSLNYGEAKYNKPRSWGLAASYYKLGDGINIVHTMNGNSELFTERYKDLTGGGFKGYKVGLKYTIAKNMMVGIEWYDLRGIDRSNFKAQTLWSEINVIF